MALLAVVLILIAWAVIAIRDATKPTLPPIDNIQEHCKTIQQLPDKKARQKYLKNLSKRK
ncbi:hypothetical protein [Ruminococcus sp. YE282]|uniref:hypothetical protein n=1 Tax=Ruminococcus sp. YE282 TaxID=3158780 RepID=UPI0008811FBB|nr:hypothetical protein SAMN02910441_00174 [Ruminococcus bromii]